MNIFINSYMKCITCSTPLTGRQTKFCSTKCKGADVNNRHNDYAAQRIRGESRKLDLIKMKGGQCEICGYNRNYSALCFHHLHDKEFQIDIRHCSNRSWEKLVEEANKCNLLCHNCHMEIHYPDNVVRPTGFEPITKKL